jgi:hypothetical protein
MNECDIRIHESMYSFSPPELNPDDFNKAQA